MRRISTKFVVNTHFTLSRSIWYGFCSIDYVEGLTLNSSCSMLVRKGINEEDDTKMIIRDRLNNRYGGSLQKNEKLNYYQ